MVFEDIGRIQELLVLSCPSFLFWDQMHNLKPIVFTFVKNLRSWFDPIYLFFSCSEFFK